MVYTVRHIKQSCTLTGENHKIIVLMKLVQRLGLGCYVRMLCDVVQM